MNTSDTKYAIELSNDGVSLWHRLASGGWDLLGKVALGEPDFSEKIAVLKKKYIPKDGSKLVAEVRIPRSEVFISKLNLEGASGDAATSKINRFLEKNTPYKAKDLVIDQITNMATDKTCLAAITKQTLKEASDFVSGYGFRAAYYTTTLDKADFPRDLKFYDGKRPDIAPPGAPKVPPLTNKPAQEMPLTAPVKPDLSGFKTVRSKLLVTPEIRPGKTSSLPPRPPSPTPRRRISIDLPKQKETTTPALATAPVTAPLKMPLGEANTAHKGSFFNPRILFLIAAIVVAAVLYWFYITLFDGKTEISQRQQISDTKPVAVSEPHGLTYQIAPDAAPYVDSTSSGDTTLNSNSESKIALPKPEPLETAQDRTDIKVGSIARPPKPPAQVIAPTPAAPKATRQPDAPETAAQAVTDAIAATTTAELTPTKEGTAGPEGIRLYLGQPDIMPPRREQLKVSTDPLKNIPPKMRSAEFENNHKAEVPLETTPNAVTETAPTPPPDADVTTPDAPDLLASADPALKTILPKPRPSAIARIAHDAQNSLLAKADPALASSKPRRRPANLAVAKPQTINPSEIDRAIQQANNDNVRPRTRPKNLPSTAAKANRNGRPVQTAALSPASARGTSVASPGASPVNIQKEATEKTGLKKRRILLIGVFGSPATRRAMLRMPSGRFVTVKPGQKISGWKVAAIGESSVRITKGSRNQVLRMPK
ncbi:MAG: hypothetical protein QM492_01125 [Rhodobacterales bacterium]